MYVSVNKEMWCYFGLNVGKHLWLHKKMQSTAIEKRQWKYQFIEFYQSFAFMKEIINDLFFKRNNLCYMKTFKTIIWNYTITILFVIYLNTKENHRNTMDSNRSWTTLGMNMKWSIVSSFNLFSDFTKHKDLRVT